MTPARPLLQGARLLWAAPAAFLALAPVPVRAEGAKPKPISECVKTRVLAEPGLQSRLIEQGLCAGGETLREGSKAPSSALQARRCDRLADGIRRDIAQKARTRCGETVDPASLADLRKVTLDPGEQYDAGAVGMRNRYNAAEREAVKGSLGAFEGQIEQLEASERRYEELNLSPCLRDKVFGGDQPLLQQMKDVAACESPQPLGRGERPQGGFGDCKAKRRMLEQNLDRRARNRCREAVPPEALQRLDVILIGLGEPVVSDVPYTAEPAPAGGAGAEPTPKIIDLMPGEKGGAPGVSEERLKAQRGGGASVAAPASPSGGIVATPSAAPPAGEPPPKMKIIDVRPGKNLPPVEEIEAESASPPAKKP